MYMFETLSAVLVARPFAGSSTVKPYLRPICNVTCHYYALYICLLSVDHKMAPLFCDIRPPRCVPTAPTLTQSSLRIVNDVSIVVILRQSLPCGSSSSVAGARFVLKALAGFPSSAYILHVLQPNQATKDVCD